MKISSFMFVAFLAFAPVPISASALADTCGSPACKDRDDRMPLPF
jgi:hypothetical protein